MIFTNSIEEHIITIKTLIPLKDDIERLAAAINKSFKSGKKLLIMGNGGSAADSQHLAAELVVRYKKHRKGLPAIALTTDASILTATGNDLSFEDIFARQIESIASAGDTVLGISTSGKSPNVLKGLKKAKETGCITSALLGNKGGNIASCVDIPVIVDSGNTPRIQECHGLIIHILCELIEKEL